MDQNDIVTPEILGPATFKVPEEIWLAGKGPSLDTYDWTQANKWRFAINETAFVVPECMGAYAIDTPVLKKFLELDDDIIIFRKRTQLHFEYARMFLWMYEQCSVKIRIASAPTFIQILYFLGARKIHFVGFDSMTTGTGEQAQCIKDINGQGKCSDGYQMINTHIKKILDIKNIEAVWEHDLSTT